MTITNLVNDLEVRGITEHDVEDVVQALVSERYCAANDASMTDASKEKTALAISGEVARLTAGGLIAQVTWMFGYFGNATGPRQALSGYLAVARVA